MGISVINWSEGTCFFYSLLFNDNLLINNFMHTTNYRVLCTGKICDGSMYDLTTAISEAESHTPACKLFLKSLQISANLCVVSKHL